MTVRASMMIVFTLAMLATAMAASTASAQAIFWASDPVLPGETILVTGEDFGAAPRVTLRARSATDAGATVRYEASALRAHTQQSLAIDLPARFPAGAYEITVTGDGGRTAVKWVNGPHVYWLQGDAGTSARPGGHVRVFGRVICADLTACALTMKRDGRAATGRLRAVRGDLWEAEFAVPAGLSDGRYDVQLDNGTGLTSEAGAIEVLAAASASPHVFDVTTFGAIGDGTANDTESLKRALAEAAKAGGTVLLPRGRFRVSAPLDIHPGVTLAGQSRELTALVFDDFDTPPEALLAGRHNFTIRDLAIYASNHRHIIAGTTRATEPRGRVSIERVRVRASYVRGHVQPPLLADRYQKSSLRFDNDTVRLGGKDIRIVDGDFMGSGRALVLYDPRGALVARNRFVNGRIGWYSITGPDGLVFEDNEIIGGDLMSTGGSVNVLEGRAFAENTMFRRNSFTRLLGWDREAFTSDGGGGHTYGAVEVVGRRTWRLLGELNEAWAKRVPDWRGAGVFILGGRGRGQWARVAALNGTTLTLDRDFTIDPDATSVVTVTSFQGRHLLLDNRFEDVGSAIQYYGTSLENVAAGNVMVRAFGMVASGRWYRHYQPSWYPQFLDNDMRDANGYRTGPNHSHHAEEGRLALWGLQRAPNTAPLLLGAVARRNHLQDNAHIEVKGGSNATAPGVADVLLENNRVSGSSVGLARDAGVTGLIVRP